MEIEAKNAPAEAGKKEHTMWDFVNWRLLWDIGIAFLVLLGVARILDAKWIKRGLAKWLVALAIVLVGGIVIAAVVHHVNLNPFHHASKAVGDGARKINWPGWWQIVIALAVIGYTIMVGIGSFKKKAWLGDKPDRIAGVTSIIAGIFLLLGVLTVGHMVCGIFLLLAGLAHASICNVQVAEQELWTPKLFGRRYSREWWMFGKEVLESGLQWIAIPRNSPGLTFITVVLRRGLQIDCVTERVPTLGAVIKAPDGSEFKVGGEVDVGFTLIVDGPTNTETYWSAPPEVRTDAGLAKYAAKIFNADFRVVLKGQSLEAIQVGGVFEGIDWSQSQAVKLFEATTGYRVRVCLVEDPTPSKEVQDQLNALAAKRIEAVQAELDKRIAIIKQEGVGEGRLAELMPLVRALQNPDIGAAVREALQAVTKRDFAARSELRVLVDKNLGPLAPYMAESSEAA